MEIRDAVESDFEEITAIYNEVLTHSTAIYNDQPTTVQERLAWWRARQQQGFPVLVATDDAVVKGFATFGDFRSWPGYRFTVEGTIHIHASARGQGIGKALLAELIRRATAAGQTYDDRRSGLREPGIHPIFTARRICAGRASARGRI